MDGIHEKKFERLKMDPAIQLALNGKSKTRETTQVFKGYKSQSLPTQAERGEEILPCLPAIK